MFCVYGKFQLLRLWKEKDIIISSVTWRLAGQGRGAKEL